MMRIQRSLSDGLNKIYNKIFNTHQCDTEKLESIRNRLDKIKKELEDMVGK